MDGPPLAELEHRLASALEAPWAVPQLKEARLDDSCLNTWGGGVALHRGHIGVGMERPGEAVVVFLVWRTLS